MNIYIYSDESGVFDYLHNDFFIYAGIILLGKEDKDLRSRFYSHAENTVRNITNIKGEIKASRIENQMKQKLYRSLNNCIKFGVVIEQKRLDKRIFNDGKHKQRYLDFAFKIVLKYVLKELIRRHIVNPNEIDNIYVYPDEHATATDGRYELEEGLYNEFKSGTFNTNYNIFFEPIFPKMKGNVFVEFCNSSSVILVRAADIVANRIFHLRLSNRVETFFENNLFLINLPGFSC